MVERLEVFHYTGQAPLAGTGERLDKYLVTCLPEFSRSRIAGLIDNGLVNINGKAARKSGQQIEAGDEIEVRIPPAQPSGLIAEDIALDIIFENDELIVVNKPAGMVVHPAAGHAGGTLVNAVLGHEPGMEGIGGEERPGLVHRLDKDTSGLIVLAKNERAHRWLQDQFRERKVEKIYLALVDGQPPTPTGRVEAAIGRDPSHRKKMAIMPADNPNKPGARGREAVSEYRTLETFPKHTLLEFHPLTGRTHQIRLHCAFLKCPIVADPIYGHIHSTIPALKRHFLHAARLKIILPGQKLAQLFEAPLPGELEMVLDKLRNG
ncbi:MAG: RluA family pseudouridine synthase [Anaerolineales bacterium]